MQILNKNANMKSDVCYGVSSRSKVFDTNIEEVKVLMSVFDELSKENKSVSNINDFTGARERVRTAQLVRVKKLEDQKRAGFALISSITVVGTLVMGIIIFMAVKAIIIG